MINMTHRPDIHMRLRPLKLRLAHLSLLDTSGFEIGFGLVNVDQVAAITRRAPA
jgi:hypothetical protein